MMDLEHARKLKKLKQQLREIKTNPFISVADEVVNNCAVYPSRDRFVSVKYNPIMRTYSVDIDATSEEDVLKIIDLVRGNS